MMMIKRTAAAVMVSALLAGCSAAPQTQPGQNSTDSTAGREESITDIKKVDFEVIPETFSMIIKDREDSILVSLPGDKRRVEDFVENENETSWTYPDEQVAVSITQQDGNLDVGIKSLNDEGLTFQWPNVVGEHYYIPFGEGKKIPADDQVWNQYLRNGSYSTIEQLSMPFWAVGDGNFAITYILDYPFYSSLDFLDKDDNQFQVTHEFPGIDQNKERHLQISLSADNPVTIAKEYRRYITDQDKFVSLQQKAADNPEVEKLYGAPHIYLWGNQIIAPENINWPKFRQELDSSLMENLKTLALKTEAGQETAAIFDEIAGQDYVSEYQKQAICNLITQAVLLDDFDQLMGRQSSGQENRYDVLAARKELLAAGLPDVFAPVDEWVSEGTTDLMTEMKESGIGQAWIGLNDLEMVYLKPEVVKAAADAGYLIGTYDSYHSIHEPGKEQWVTAAFDDQTLYDQATVTDQDGNKVTGFKNVGRKLNPTLSLPSVKQRMERMLAGDVPFNSWFIDCDATGEIYDDYTPGHLTTKQQDLNARLERMSYIRDQHGLVIGSEGGHDFAAPVIAFAHGIELRTFAWMDPDMNQNKESEYYIGKYYSPTGGVAEHFSKKVPIKDYYYQLFLNMKYEVPLYKLVYNDSVITGYHWDWSTYKIKDHENDRMLREVLYNTPPLYHLDHQEWDKYRDSIVSHTAVWSDFSKKVINLEMTGFEMLKEDGQVQKTTYGDEISVIANFSDEAYQYESQEIPAHSLLIREGENNSIYTPDYQSESS